MSMQRIGNSRARGLLGRSGEGGGKARRRAKWQVRDRKENEAIAKAKTRETTRKKAVQVVDGRGVAPGSDGGHDGIWSGCI